MKYITTIILFLLIGHSSLCQQRNDPYISLWKEVLQLESELLTKSALNKVRSISEKAKREENSAQVVKALLYTSKYALILEEDARLNIVHDFEDEIKKSAFPTANVLESYLANLYWQYFQQHRYQFYNRTRTDVIADSTDFRTWDLPTLFREITTHFERSLNQSEALQNIEVSEFEALLHQQADSELYRPTLFDLLTHTALEFYQSNETLINRPADAFEISNPMLLCEAAPYTEMDTNTKDETSLQARALHHYQELIRFHLQDKSPEALVDVDLHRLRFLYDNAVFEDKEQLYEEVLQNSAARYQGLEVSALYRFEIASLYNQWADEYQPESRKQYQWKRKEALGICKEVLAAFPKSPGAKKCADLRDLILGKELQLMVEEHIPVNKPSKLLVRYKNLNGLQFTAYSITVDQLKILNNTYPAEKQRSVIEGLSITKRWDSALKNEGDYQPHSTEVLLPPLENGLYVILAIPKNGETSFAFGHIQVTQMALLETRTPTHHFFQVVDRNNGHPLVNATIRFTYQENYDRPLMMKSFTTDERGMVAIPLSGEPWTRIQTVVTHGQDKAHFGEYYIRRKPEVKNLHTTNYSSFLFTDRSIYRPGQPLYFKGIALKNTEDISVVASGISGVVVLKDVNGQEVGEQEFITNEYGSFKGEFIVPNSGLSGIFSLQVRSKTTELRGYTTFSVEEYKRPKFETSFKPVTDTYTVNDLISLKGTAMGYAGSTVSGARVVYRVKRAVLYPR
ncbi:MAG TPA: MG2 domain-containing protein, partial [Eudoraea sp.]|nr:MG2 domain-containing protein [Eudoraea sp.]